MRIGPDRGNNKRNIFPKSIRKLSVTVTNPNAIFIEVILPIYNFHIFWHGSVRFRCSTDGERGKIWVYFCIFVKNS